MLIVRNKAFTLIELLLAVMILATAISGILLLFTVSMASTEQAWDTTVATTHGEHILEEMERRDSLEPITRMNWDLWAGQTGLKTLPGETAQVTFGAPGQDPLPVEVRVSWIRKERINEIRLKTKMTK